MERTGIDYMVVYPSVGLLSTAVPDMTADTAAPYRRAYNNWLHDFCSEAGGHVFAAASVDLGTRSSLSISNKRGSPKKD
jgi:hypothetical protein